MIEQKCVCKARRGTCQTSVQIKHHLVLIGFVLANICWQLTFVLKVTKGSLPDIVLFKLYRVELCLSSEETPAARRLDNDFPQTL